MTAKTSEERAARISTPAVEKRWRLLRTFIPLWQLAVSLVAFFGLVAGGLRLIAPRLVYGDSGDLFGGVLILAGTTMFWLSQLALAQYIELQIAQEENQRVTNRLLSYIARQRD